MKHTTHWLAAACAAALTACGGGGSDDTAANLTSDTAQGYAADATTMPVSAATGAEAAVGALEAALGSSTTSAAGRAEAQALTLPQATGTAQCLRGGSVAWTVTGGALLGNGRLDAGESYTVTYDGCVTGDNGPTVDGSLTLAVAARGNGELDFTVSASTLSFTQGGLQYVLDGSWREQRSSVTTPVGGTQITSQLTSTGLSLDTTIGPRRASYTLRTLAWTVVRTWDANGLLVARSHEGTLELAASTPRRPDASLAISTNGATTVDSDGFVSAGSFTIRTGRDTLTSTHANGTVTITLDRGNDGTIDRSWTITRQVYVDSAG